MASRRLPSTGALMYGATRRHRVSQHKVLHVKPRKGPKTAAFVTDSHRLPRLQWVRFDSYEVGPFHRIGRATYILHILEGGKDLRRQLSKRVLIEQDLARCGRTGLAS